MAPPRSGPLTLRLVDEIAALDALAGDWQRLAAASTPARPDGEGRATGVFNGWSWNRLWWTHYGHLGTLHVLVGESDDGVVRGIAPFYHTRSRLLRVAEVSTLRFLGSGGDTSPDDLDLLVEHGWDEPFAAAVGERLLPASAETPFERLELRDLPVGSAFADMLLARARRVAHAPPTVTTTFRLVDALPSDVAAWRSRTSRNARKQLKRRHHRLREAGEARFALCRRASDVDAAHAALVALHRARRESLDGTDGERAFASSRYVDFHRALMHALLARGELRLGVLWLDDVAIAVEYAFAVRGTLAFFQTGFDPEYAKLGPGHLLMHWMIERGIEDGLVRIDLLKGDYGYKSGYASARRESRSIDLCTRPMLARLVGTVRSVRDAVGRARR